MVVNPELGLNIDGAPTLVKLYFKQEELAKRRVDVIQLLMSVAFGKPLNFAVLDVQRGKLFTTSTPNNALLPLLIGEAASFAAMFPTA